MDDDEIRGGTEVGGVGPTGDPNDEALLDQLGFGNEPAQPRAAAEESPAPKTAGEDDGLPPDLAGDPATLAPKPPEDAGAAAKEVPKTGEEPPKPEVKFTDPKANHAFAELRHQNGELTRKLAALEQELQKAKQAGPQVDELKGQYETRIQELEEQIGQYDLASTTGFKQKYDSVLGSLLGKAAGLLKKAGASEEEAQRIVSELRSKKTLERAQELNDFAPALSGPVVNIFEDFDELLLKRETELRNWKESRESIQEEERRLGKSKALQIADTLASSTLTELESERNPFFTKSQTDSAWNEKVDQRSLTYKGLLKTGDPAVLSKLVAEGLAAKEFQKLYLAERQKRLEYQKAIEDSRSLSGAPGSRPTGDPVARPRIQEQLSDDELLTKLGF